MVVPLARFHAVPLLLALLLAGASLCEALPARGLRLWTDRQQQLQRRRALQAEQEGDALLGTVAGSDYLDLENTCRKADFYLTLLLAVDTAAWNGTQEAAACYNGEAAALASGLCELGTSLVGPRTRSDYLSSFYTASFPNGTISEVYGHVEMIRPEYAVLPSSSEGVLYATAGLEADCAAGSGHDCLKWYKLPLNTVVEFVCDEE